MERDTYALKREKEYLYEAESLEKAAEKTEFRKSGTNLLVSAAKYYAYSGRYKKTLEALENADKSCEGNYDIKRLIEKTTYLIDSFGEYQKPKLDSGENTNLEKSYRKELSGIILKIELGSN